MSDDFRSEVLKGYCSTAPFDDLSFYVQQLNTTDHVLELGCGTGRILLPLTNHCQYIHGLDKSAEMVDLCRQKLLEKEIGPKDAKVQLADMTDFELGQRFDLVIAPFRGFQCVISKKGVNSFFKCVRKHLKQDGKCILNVFKPFCGLDELEKMWSEKREILLQEISCEGGKITISEKQNKFVRNPLTIYPSEITRKYRDGKLIDQVQFNTPIRCYYPDEFEQLILDHGFVITNRWGGYNSEEYGKGDELVIEFKVPAQ